MKKLELLRQKLYSAISRGDSKEILALSRKLDKEIVKYTRKSEIKEGK